MRWLAFIAIALLSNCGVSYVAPTAELRVEFRSTPELNAASIAIQEELRRLGFEVQPDINVWPNAAQNGFPPDAQKLVSRKITFWRHAPKPINSDMHGDMIELSASSGSISASSGDATPPLVQITLSDFTPGGFSPEGLRVYDEFVGFLHQNNYTVTVVTPPPPTNDKERARVERPNLAAAIGWWMAVWSISMLVLGGLAMWCSRAAKAGKMVRRLVLFLVGVFLATPFPASSAFVSIFLPNALILLFGPSFYTDLWVEAGKMIVYPLLASTCLSVIAAAILVRDRRTGPIDS